MATAPRTRYAFDDVVVDAENYRVYKAGELRPIGPRAFDLLLDLVAHPGRVVSKQELFDRVWSGIAVTDNALTRAVKDLRWAIGDRAQAPKYIETAPRRGYRFIADARELSAERRVTVVVLGFDDLSTVPEAYMADGLAEELAAELGRVSPERLTAIGRTSAVSGRATRPWSEIGRQLDVDYVVRGSIRRERGRVRASVQLARGADDALEWIDTVDVDGVSVQRVPSSLAEAIAARVRVQLSQPPAATATRPIDPDAHAALLEGRHFLRQRTAESMVKALAAFERAVAIEPTFARAYVGAAHSHAFTLMGAARKTSALARARALVTRALALDDRLAEAHAVLALLQSADWRSADAERSLRWAIALDPNEPTARHWLAMFPLAASGRYEEALDELRRARRLDPLSLIISADIAGVYCMTRQFDRAIAQCTESLHLDPNFARAHVYLGWARLALGHHDAAVVALETASRLDRSPWTTAWLGHVYAAAGRTSQATQVLQAFLDMKETGPSERPFYVGLVYAGLGDLDHSLAWLERAVAERSLWVAGLEAFPALDPLRSNRRFRVLARRIREAAWPESTVRRGAAGPATT